MSQSKISRIESGRTIPTVADVERMLKGLEPIPSDVADHVLSLARVANVEHASWRSVVRSGLWRKQAEIKALTESSEKARHFLPVVPQLAKDSIEVHVEIHHKWHWPGVTCV